MSTAPSLSSLAIPLRPLPPLSVLGKVTENIKEAISSGAAYDSWDKDYVLNFCTRLLTKLEMDFDSDSDAEVAQLSNSLSELILRLNSKSLDAADGDYVRTFKFPYTSPFTQSADGEAPPQLQVLIRDAAATDIGSQTWNSAPLLSRKIAKEPMSFFSPISHQQSVSQDASMKDQAAVALQPTPPPTRPATPSTAARAQALEPFRILELGSGTGLTGITAAVCLARLIREHRQAHPSSPLRPVQLVLTDYLPPVIDNLRHNVDINRGAIEMEGLDVQVELLDWRDLHSSNVKGSFELVLGTDLVYEIQHAWWAAKVVEHFLARPSPTRPKPVNVLFPPTPADSRAASPTPEQVSPVASSEQRPQDPIFHLVLALRPTFLAESRAVHEAFNSPFEPPSSKDNHMALPHRKVMPSTEHPQGSVAPDGRPATEEARGNLIVKSCETLVGISHGQGCGDYQYLTVAHKRC